MYNNVYQEYINNILGTTPKQESVLEYNSYRNSNYFQNSATNIELEKFYPELYKILYPMIQTACMRNTKPITQETIDEMVKEIYSNFNADDVTIMNINLTNDVRSTSKSSEIQKSSNSSKSISKNIPETRNTQNERQANLRPNNYILNDLIRILIIRELLGRPGNVFPIRPGFPPQGPGRQPFRPREINFNNQDLALYEEPHMYTEFNSLNNITGF